MKLQSLSVQQILALTDLEIDALSASEQRVVAEVVEAVLDFELRRSSPRTEDPRKPLSEILSNLIPITEPDQKAH